MPGPSRPPAPRRPVRVVAPLFLLLNLAILLSNFAVSWGASETQTRVLRSTARLFHGVPRPGPALAGVRVAETAPRPPGPPSEPPHSQRRSVAGSANGSAADVRARLARFLVRMPGVERLSSAQVGALYRGAECTSRRMQEVGACLGSGGEDGGRVRDAVLAADRRMREEVLRSLRSAAIPEGPMLDRLVRIVVASAG